MNKNAEVRSKVLFYLCLSVLFAVFTTALNGASKIGLGIDHLERTKFRVLQGKRVGLLTHPAGMNAVGQSTVEVLRRQSNLNLVALFGPEHGIYGDEKAAVPVDDKVDSRTGLPVFSLYGKFRKPSPKMLRKIDALVVDLQDVGVRCYTYISCMRYAMEACFENGVEVIVLDRPNPLGGLLVDGPPMDEKWMSYVGAFRVPFVHGLTIGELALFSKKTPGVLEIEAGARRKGKLTVVPMIGWKRSMTWPQTGLKWVPTSPNIPTLDSVAGYPMTGLGAQLGKFRHGIGTPHPFRFLTFEGRSPVEIKRELEALRLPGLKYQLKTVVNSKGKSVSGVYLVVNDWKEWRPTALAFHMMKLSAKWESPQPFAKAAEAQSILFNKHVGSSAWWSELSTRGAASDPDKFLREWRRSSQLFQASTRKFFLYD
jgi:uncharacterized protein YbbC (DUF1343 family)